MIVSFSVIASFALLLAAPPQDDPFAGLTPAARARMDALMKKMDEGAAKNRAYTEQLVTCRGLVQAMPMPADPQAAARRVDDVMTVRGALYHFMEPNSFDHVATTEAQRSQWLAAGAALAKAPDAQARATACGTTGYESLNRLVDIVKGTGEERKQWEQAQADYAKMHYDELGKFALCAILLDANKFPESGVSAETSADLAATIRVVFYAEGILSMMQSDEWPAMQNTLTDYLHKQKTKDIRNSVDGCLLRLRDAQKVDAITAPVSH
jgi:hypothetical protein